MKLKSKPDNEKLPVPPPTDSVAASEVSLYRNVLKIKQEHGLEELGISFCDAQTTIQWSYNADHYFHAASTMKLAVLLGVFRADRSRRAVARLRRSTCATASPASSTRSRSCSTSAAMPIPTSTATSARR